MRLMKYGATLSYMTLLAFAVPMYAFGATIVSHSESSADTGGLSIISGKTVTGDSSASVSVHNVINVGDSGASADVTVTSEQDGDVHTELQHVDIPMRVAASVSVATLGKSVAMRTISTTRSSQAIATTSTVLASSTTQEKIQTWIDEVIVPLRLYIAHFLERLIDR
jgi:hypothetical protein